MIFQNRHHHRSDLPVSEFALVTWDATARAEPRPAAEQRSTSAAEW